MNPTKLPPVTTSGYLTVNGFRIWHEWYGPYPAIAPPLVALHGGPGYPHDYLEPLAHLAESGRSVIFYDQVGCGKSQRLRRRSLYNIDLFVQELVGVRKVLGLNTIHLLGHSWGAMLALAYLTGKRRYGIQSLTLASGVAASQQFVDDCKELLAEMPANALSIVEKCEQEGCTDTAEFQRVTKQFFKRHIFRGKRVPSCMKRSHAGSGPSYNRMWGPTEFTCTGNLKQWSVSDRLSRITVPTLVTCGRYDESTPKTNRRIAAAITGARLKIFKHSAHMAHLEETDAYLAALNKFLAANDP